MSFFIFCFLFDINMVSFLLDFEDQQPDARKVGLERSISKCGVR